MTFLCDNKKTMLNIYKVRRGKLFFLSPFAYWAANDSNVREILPLGFNGHVIFFLPKNPINRMHKQHPLLVSHDCGGWKKIFEWEMKWKFKHSSLEIQLDSVKKILISILNVCSAAPFKNVRIENDENLILGTFQVRKATRFHPTTSFLAEQCIVVFDEDWKCLPSIKWWEKAVPFNCNCQFI